MRVFNELHFTKNSKEQYWTKEEVEGESRLVFYSYGKPIFLFSLETRDLVFIRSGWTQTTARHAKLAMEQWDKYFDLGVMRAVNDLITLKKVRNFKGFLEGTEMLSLLDGGKWRFFPYRYGTFLKGYFE